MRETKFTPGPWYADEHGKIWRRPVSDLYERGGDTAGDHPVAEAFRGQTYWKDGFPVEANARLIAAAPDLYEALTICLDFIQGTSAEKPWHYGGEPVQKARAALTKATGEPQ